MNLQKYSRMFVKKISRMVSLGLEKLQPLDRRSHGTAVKMKTPGFSTYIKRRCEQTVRRIERKKAGHRLVFDDSKTIDPVDCKSSVSQPTTLPKATVLSVSSAPQIRNTREAGSQTVKSSCHCWQSSGQGTCVKVCTISELQLSV